MTTYRQLLQWGRRMLTDAGIENARCESDWIMENVSGLGLARLLSSLDQHCPPADARIYVSRVDRRCRGEPLQHLLGTVDFYGYELAVGPGVLIPRPETEYLVELALRHYPGNGMVCDVCTGSGAIALVLAMKLADRPIVVGGDLFSEALGYAARNRQFYQVENLHLFHGDLFNPFRPEIRFALITANPPYVSSEEYASLPREVREYDPPSALLAGDRGLAMVRRVIREAWQVLSPAGWLFCEIGENQAGEVQSLMIDIGYEEARVEKDLCGRPRIAIGRKSLKNGVYD